jgi:hypothetical protein
MDKNVLNLAASIVNDKRFTELKSSLYEELVKNDHSTVVAVFKMLQEWATQAEDNKFETIERPKIEKVTTHDLDIDPDLDDTLTPEEINLRK